jgi:hypothetical protein
MKGTAEAQLIPKDLLEDVELDLVAQDRCTELKRSGREFCGRPAVAYQASGPRCEKHLKEREAAEYLERPAGI